MIGAWIIFDLWVFLNDLSNCFLQDNRYKQNDLLHSNERKFVDFTEGKRKTIHHKQTAFFFQLKKKLF